MIQRDQTDILQASAGLPAGIAARAGMSPLVLAAARDQRSQASLRRVPIEDPLAAKAQRMLDLVKQRDAYFRRSIMADGTMGVMLSLFLAELQAVAITDATLSLVTLLDSEAGRGVVDSLSHAGLVVMTGSDPARRTVGLTPLGSARMRSFISDYPDI